MRITNAAATRWCIVNRHDEALQDHEDEQHRVHQLVDQLPGSDGDRALIVAIPCE
jgi:hypothetical protein